MSEYIKKPFENKNGIFSFSIKDTETKKSLNFIRLLRFQITKIMMTNNQYLKKEIRTFQLKNLRILQVLKKVLEVGCGTGQLSIYFSLSTNNRIVGFDPTIQSLNLAKDFAFKNEISNIEFVNADIFDDVLVDNYFDFVWCNGVLHHTKDPYKAFQIVARSLKMRLYTCWSL